MKAIVVRTFGTPEVLRLEEVPDPAPGAGQVLVRVAAAGVNPVDAYVRTGNYVRVPSLPYVPGFDLAGTVDAIGPGITGLGVGTRVYAHGVAGGHGAYAELAVCPAELVHPLPDAVTFAQGAALGVPYGTAWRALLVRAAAQAGDTVLVHGASGGVGLAAVQIARARGLRVIATAGSPRGLAVVSEQGAHAALDHHADGYLDQVRELTGGRGVDVVLEMLANVNLDRDLDVLAPGGRVVVIGSRGRVEIDPRKTMGRETGILGMTLFAAGPDELRRAHAGIGAGLENGTLRPVVGRNLPLADAARAHAAVMEPGTYGKIVLEP